MTTERMMRGQIAPKKKVCLHSFQFWNSEATPQQKRPAGEKTTSKYAAMLGALVSIFESPIFFTSPDSKGVC